MHAARRHHGEPSSLLEPARAWHLAGGLHQGRSAPFVSTAHHDLQAHRDSLRTVHRHIWPQTADRRRRSRAWMARGNCLASPQTHAPLPGLAAARSSGRTPVEGRHPRPPSTRPTPLSRGGTPCAMTQPTCGRCGAVAGAARSVRGTLGGRRRVARPRRRIPSGGYMRGGKERRPEGERQWEAAAVGGVPSGVPFLPLPPSAAAQPDDGLRILLSSPQIYGWPLCSSRLSVGLTRPPP
jgi:hypothetical protein